MRLSVFTLLFTLVAAFHTVIPTQAEAASALFRVKRSWLVSDTVNWRSADQTTYISTDFHPIMKGPSKAPPAQAYVPRTMSGDHFFTIRSKVIKDYTRTR
jgi:hypothetical protein